MDKTPFLELEENMLILQLLIQEALILEFQMKCLKIYKRHGVKIFMIWTVSLMITSAK